MAELVVELQRRVLACEFARLAWEQSASGWSLHICSDADAGGMLSPTVRLTTNPAAFATSYLSGMALSQPERRVLVAARDGNERAFATLVDAYQRPVQAYVTRMVGDAGLAEDLTQDVFVRVYSRLSTFRGQSAFTTWLFQIAKNRVLDELRAQTRRPREALELTDAGAPDGEPTDHTRETDETIAAIWRAVSQLNLDLKTTLLLRDVAGLSYREIAATLDIELTTVKWRIYTARETIQRSLAAQGLSPDFARHKHQQSPDSRPQETTKVALSPTP